MRGKSRQTRTSIVPQTLQYLVHTASRYVFMRGGSVDSRVGGKWQMVLLDRKRNRDQANHKIGVRGQEKLGDWFGVLSSPWVIHRIPGFLETASEANFGRSVQLGPATRTIYECIYATNLRSSRYQNLFTPPFSVTTVPRQPRHPVNNVAGFSTAQHDLDGCLEHRPQRARLRPQFAS